MGDAGGVSGSMAAHWAAIYGGGISGGGGNGGGAAETVSSPTSGGSGGAGSPTRAAAAMGVEGGRVAKPARRRSRASRRAPVTLLNTDTSNFRAMVQQFTGIPAAPYGHPSAAGSGPVISFGAGVEFGGGAMTVRPSPTPASVMSFDHLGQHRHAGGAAASLHNQLFRPQPHQQQYSGGGEVGYGGGGEMFLHGFDSTPEDRLLLQSIQAAQMMPRPASANNATGYNFG